MRFALCCVVAAGGLATAPETLARTQILKTDAGAVVHWTRAEITVGLDTQAASRTVHRLDVLLTIDRAIAVWNRIPADQPRFRRKSGGPADVTVRFCRGAWQGEAIDLGRTQFEASQRDGSVTAATVELNECDHRFTPPGDGPAGNFDLQAIVSHELGHVLGLGHADVPTAMMYANGRRAGTRFPTAEDELGLALIYLGRRLSAPSVAAVATSPDHPLPSALAEQPSTDTSAWAGQPTPPQDSVSAITLKPSDGRALTVYTCEPTLLPAIAGIESPAPKSATTASEPRRAKRR